MAVKRVFATSLAALCLLGESVHGSFSEVNQQATTGQAKPPTKQQATPAKGNKSSQPIDVSTPYCDAYLPYTFDSDAQTMTEVFTPGTLPNDAAINQFLNQNQSTSEAIVSGKSFSDPGYPILGKADNKFFSDGSDLTRLITRLTKVDKATGHPPASLCPAVPPSAATARPDSLTQYYLVNIVRWKRVGGAYQTDSSDWYIFNQSDAKAAHREFPFTFRPVVNGDKDLRIFGSKQVFFLAIHLAPQGDYSDFSQKVKINYKLDVTKIEPANIQDLKALIGVVVGGGTAGGAGVIPPNPNLDAYTKLLKTYGSRPYDGVYAAARLMNLENLPVQIAATRNAALPKPDANLADAGVHQETGFWDQLAAKATVVSPAAGTSQTGCSTVGNTGVCPETLTVQNEGLYWWDVSIGIPFKGIKQLQFDSTGTGQVTPRTVTKGSAYGFVVLAPWKEDIVSPPSLAIPHILIGLPLSGKVFNSPFVGFGETFNASKLPTIGGAIGKVLPIGIRFYAGLVENKEFGPPPTSGTTGPPHKWVGKLQYGIEFSVRDIANKLTTKASTPSTKPKK